MESKKKKGPHPVKALSAVKVRSLKKSGRYADGNGLYLVVDPSGAKRWALRTVVQGKRCDIGLGSLRLVSLAEAREESQKYRKVARSGGDPIAERRREQATIPTFKEAAQLVHADHAQTWKNAKHSNQWINSLKQHAFPELENLRVDTIGTANILKVLSAIWLTKPETARRVRQRIGTVLDWAKASGFRTGSNPLDGIEKGLPKQPSRKSHHAALPYIEIPKFIKKLHKSDASEIVHLAFEFLILTAARTSEVLGATWSEVDLKSKTWAIPAERIKSARAHRVPISSRCLEILARAKELTDGGDYIFPGRIEENPISNMALLMTLRRMKIDVTVHGFRSSFRDWASERTNFPRDVCELALAHVVPDKTEAAYRRGDLFDKRKKLMESWSRFATSGSADVISLIAS